MNTSSRVLVAGSRTPIGAAIVSRLKDLGYSNILSGPEDEPDLTDAADVDGFFARHAPDHVFLVAGKSGGIAANQNYPADLMLDNLLTTSHVVHSAHRHRVEKLLYLASACCYPRECPQPMRVAHLFTGPLEPTNEAYATAKLAGIKLCQSYRRQFGMDFVVGIPANPFGPGDDFSPGDSHVIASLIRKMHEAKAQGAESVEIWGTGNPRREFISYNELADASIHVMLRYSESEPINIGSGTDLSIGELAELITEAVGYSGELRYDTSRPDGMPFKTLDSSKLTELGWRPRSSFRTSLSATYQWFLETRQESRATHVR